MRGNELLQSKEDIRSAEKYLVLNLASDSIKADAKILQLSVRLPDGEIENRFVAGGNPAANNDFTLIDLTQYTYEAQEAEKIEDFLVDLIKQYEIEYVVYNNASWNARLLKNNAWLKILTYTNLLPFFPISDYEAIRRYYGETLFTYEIGTFAGICRRVAASARSLPAGYRKKIDVSFEERELDLSTVPQNITAAETTVYMLNKIWSNILQNEEQQEKYVL